jgi:hypothetical protein
VTAWGMRIIYGHNMKTCQRTARNIVFVLKVELMRHIVKSLAGVSSRHNSETDRLELPPLASVLHLELVVDLSLVIDSVLHFIKIVGLDSKAQRIVFTIYL